MVLSSHQITVDLSPPHPGQVHDGVSGSPEEDYKSTTDLHAYWWGFFDRESGVKYYQYAFDTACVAASVFSHELTDSRVGMARKTGGYGKKRVGVGKQTDGCGEIYWWV